MAKIPFSAVSANNQKEFDVMVQWNLRNRPDGDTARLVAEVFSSKPSKQAALSAVLQTRSSQSSDSSAQLVAVHHDESGKLKKAHVRRKHRGDCPKHLYNEIVRAGLTPAPTHDDKRASLDPLNNSAVSLELPRLPVPHMVGRGLGEFLAGVRNPSYDKAHSKHRPTLEHPNFSELSANLDATIAKESKTFVATDLKQRLPAWLLEEKLVSEEKDYRHHRTKYEMKAHMEAVRMMGKALLREFSGAAFK